MAQDGNQITPTSGHILVTELEPTEQNQLTSGSSMQIAGGNEHSQLKLGRVVENGGPSIEDRERAANIHKVADYSNFLSEAPHGIKPGAIVAFQSLSAHALRVAGKQYYLVPSNFINAVVEAK